MAKPNSPRAASGSQRLSASASQRFDAARAPFRAPRFAPRPAAPSPPPPPEQCPAVPSQPPEHCPAVPSPALPRHVGPAAGAFRPPRGRPASLPSAGPPEGTAVEWPPTPRPSEEPDSQRQVWYPPAGVRQHGPPRPAVGWRLCRESWAPDGHLQTGEEYDYDAQFDASNTLLFPVRDPAERRHWAEAERRVRPGVLPGEEFMINVTIPREREEQRRGPPNPLVPPRPQVQADPRPPPRDRGNACHTRESALAEWHKKAEWEWDNRLDDDPELGPTWKSKSEFCEKYGEWRGRLQWRLSSPERGLAPQAVTPQRKRLPNPGGRRRPTGANSTDSERPDTGTLSSSTNITSTQSTG
eukprot:TRINITY_DN44637_c0_g1_i1.p1 TRINITY_DN44637_c0_g1~~TRINITY_DN44637_c0_g1_i1.p1  ORF type:complete len:375 (+),score=36.57 TRINITY_DN44637_c0_g1_i1:62-1126(+)